MGTGRASIAVVAIILLTGCVYAPSLSFVSGPRIFLDDMMQDAPVVIIGRVLRQEGVGPIRNSYRLVRVTLDVENVIRGELGRRRVPIYFYTPWGTVSGEINSLRTGKRYVHFLMWDKGVLRAVRDVVRTSIRIYSGQHVRLPLTPDRPLGERLAMLLFVPGAELDPDEFSAGLLDASAMGWNELGRFRTAQLLRGLLRNEHPQVRIAACEELSRLYPGMQGCWETVDFGDGSLLRSRFGVIGPQVYRKAYRNWVERTRDAQAWWRLAPKRYEAREILDELKLLTMSDDAGVRRRFCQLLKEKFPNEPGCELTPGVK